MWQHIGHLKAKPIGAAPLDTQLNKSLFASELDFWKAWRNLVGKGKCEKTKFVTTGKDCVKATTLGIRSAYQCKAVDKDNLCTSMKAITPISVEFYYYKNNIRGWILRTAFPSKRNC